eukprot:39973-Prymnesium_polylepis.1
MPPQVIHFDAGVNGASVHLQQAPSHQHTSAAFVTRSSPPAEPVSIVAPRGNSILRAHALVACCRQCGISANRACGIFMKMISPTIVAVWKQEYKVQRIKSSMHQMQVADTSGSGPDGDASNTTCRNCTASTFSFRSQRGVTV